MQRFAQALDTFLQSLPKRPVFLDNVYDPTFGNDRLNSLDIEPSLQGASEIHHCFLRWVLAYLHHGHDRQLEQYLLTQVAPLLDLDEHQGRTRIANSRQKGVGYRKVRTKTT